MEAEPQRTGRNGEERKKWAEGRRVGFCPRQEGVDPGPGTERKQCGQAERCKTDEEKP